MSIAKCTFKDCHKNATFAFKHMQPVFCPEHGRLSGARRKEKICLCGSAVPTYKLESDPRPCACLKCKTPQMKDFRNNKCIDCGVRASYGERGGKTLYCAKHKKEGHIDLVNPACLETGCTTIPVFGTEYKKPLYCETHKKDGMKNVVEQRCCFEGCESRAFYGTIWQKPVRCSTHKTDGMNNVVSKRCETEGCDKMPTYGIEKGKATHCLEHKDESMKDVKHGFCEGDGCNIRPSFGYKTHKPLRCVDHKLEDMISVVGKKCEIVECRKSPCFALEGEVACRCFKHKTPQMKDVVHTKLMCPGPPGKAGPDGKCPFTQRGTPKYDGLCTSCFPIAFPSDPRTPLIRKNSEELYVRDYLIKNNKELEFVHDTPLWTANCECDHRRRIDFRAVVEGTMLAIEVDEQQHKSKDSSDEVLRYDDVFMLFSGKWIFIRYNPHMYKGADGKRKNPTRAKRLMELGKAIEAQIERIRKGDNSELLEIQKLFYDSS
jgi:hypothetical protein